MVSVLPKPLPDKFISISQPPSNYRIQFWASKVMGPGKRQILNKLVLGRFVTVQKQYVSRIRAGIHNLKCGKVAGPELDDYAERLEGSIGYLRLFDAGKARKFQEQLEIVRVLATSA
jgi:hypothetical protein